jgi:hypothetical protein
MGLFFRLLFRRRRSPAHNRVIPAAAAIAPYTAQRIWPVMKLPGNRLIPCRNQMAPKSARTPPAMLKAVFMSSGCGYLKSLLNTTA